MACEFPVAVKSWVVAKLLYTVYLLTYCWRTSGLHIIADSRCRCCCRLWCFKETAADDEGMYRHKAPHRGRPVDHEWDGRRHVDAENRANEQHTGVFWPPLFILTPEGSWERCCWTRQQAEAKPSTMRPKCCPQDLKICSRCRLWASSDVPKDQVLDGGQDPTQSGYFGVVRPIQKHW